MVQVMPSGLVITRFPVPLLATATNFSCPAGPPHVTALQELSAADVCVVQVMHSGLVVTRFTVTQAETARDWTCPEVPPQVTALEC